MDKPQFKAGDRVAFRCPHYSYLESHNGRIIGDPQLKGSSWVVPVRYRCTYYAETAVIPCSALVKVRGYNMGLSKNAIKVGIILLVVFILSLWLAGNYNSLVHARNDVRTSKSKVDTELARRYDLIDNIVQSVQGSQAQESDVFGKIAEARKQGSSTNNPEQQAQANDTINQQIALLPRLQESYPELKSNDQVTRLIQELQGTNDTIRDKRNNYNDVVNNYNNNVTSFPKNIFASIFGFKEAERFEANANEKINPKVELDREKN